MQVAKEFKFHAAHRDESAPEGDQCGRLHGHTYVLRVVVDARPDERGMVIHGDVLKDIYVHVIEPLVEHQYLNESLNREGLGLHPYPHLNPTMENVLDILSAIFHTHLLSILGSRLNSVTVRLWETPTMWAEVTKP